MEHETKTEVIMILDTPNKNGRIYKSDAIAMAISNHTAPLWCHIDHPIDSQIDMGNVVAEATNLRIDSNTVVADIKMLMTPSSAMIAGLLESGDAVYRAWGHGILDPITLEVSDFTICGVSILPAHAVL